MDTISSISTSSSYASMQTSSVAQTGSTSGTTSSSTVSGESMSASVYSSVSTMLSDIGGGLDSNEMLKTAIALLILNMLMNKDSNQDVSDMMGALAAGMLAQNGGASGGSLMMTETMSMSITIDQPVSSGYATSAYSGGTSAAAGSTGSVNATA